MDNTNTLQILIAILLAYVAWQNYKINEKGLKIQKDKLRLDLFERRLVVYEACQNFLSSFELAGRVINDELVKFLKDSSNAEFLFGKEISEYVDKIGKKTLRHKQVLRRLEDTTLLVGDKRNQLAIEAEQIEEWIQGQREECRSAFRKYLHFSIDKTP